MQSLISKIGLDNGYNRRINVDLFGDRAAVKALPAKDGYPEVVGVAANDGAAFVLAETSLDAVAEYAALRASRQTPLNAFAHAFKAYFVAEDMSDFAAAAANFEASASYADTVAEAQADASSKAAQKAAESAALAAQKAKEAAAASQAAADAAQAHADDLSAAASASAT